MWRRGLSWWQSIYESVLHHEANAGQDGMFTRLWLSEQSMKRTGSSSRCAHFLLSASPKEKNLDVKDSWYEITDTDIFSLFPSCYYKQATQPLTGVASEQYSHLYTMNLHGGHFLFSYPKHDARWTSCCRLQDVWLWASLICIQPKITSTALSSNKSQEHVLTKDKEDEVRTNEVQSFSMVGDDAFSVLLWW